MGLKAPDCALCKNCTFKHRFYIIIDCIVNHLLDVIIHFHYLTFWPHFARFHKCFSFTCSAATMKSFGVDCEHFIAVFSAIRSTVHIRFDFVPFKRERLEFFFASFHYNSLTNCYNFSPFRRYLPFSVSLHSPMHNSVQFCKHETEMLSSWSKYTNPTQTDHTCTGKRTTHAHWHVQFLGYSVQSRSILNLIILIDHWRAESWSFFVS